MKHTIRAVLAAAIVLAGLTLVTPHAGAVSFQTPTPAAVAGMTPAPVPGAHPNVSVQCCGWGTVLVLLNHNDTGSVITKGLFDGLGAEELYLCGLLGDSIIAGAVCVALVVAQIGLINYYLLKAWNNVTYAADFNCSFTTWYCPGGIHTFWGWVIAQRDSGLNILMSWIGNPMGYEVNPYSG